MNILDLNYRILIMVFVAGIPIYFGNAIVTYEYTNEPFLVGLFSSLLVVDMALVVLFFHLWQENKPRTIIKNWLTVGNICAIIFSTLYLINHIPSGTI